MEILLDKNFVKPSYLCTAEKFGEINSANAVKVNMSSMQS